MIQQLVFDVIVEFVFVLLRAQKACDAECISMCYSETPGWTKHKVEQQNSAL